jgi:CheY-like chemotaxis protein
VPSVLICAPDPLTDELHGTLIWREGIERHVATRFQDALLIVHAAHPDVIVVDIQLADAVRLVTNLRADKTTRNTSIVVMARGSFVPSELEYLAAGANAILRLPPGPEWDERLGALLLVPTRRATRLAVEMQLEARSGPDAVETVSGTVVNLSQTGMFVETDLPLSMGADLDFRIHVGDGKPPVVGSGQIVRQRDLRNSGVRFYGLEADGADRIRKFIDA